MLYLYLISFQSNECEHMSRGPTTHKISKGEVSGPEHGQIENIICQRDLN